jgi:hypothetical protein
LATFDKALHNRRYSEKNGWISSSNEREKESPDFRGLAELEEETD